MDAELYGPAEMEITLKKTPGRSLGCRVAKDDVKLHVTHIEEGGLLAEWNEENPELAVEPADAFVSVNGIDRDARLMSRECRDASVLHLLVQKGARLSSAAAAAC